MKRVNAAIAFSFSIVLTLPVYFFLVAPCPSCAATQIRSGTMDDCRAMPGWEPEAYWDEFWSEERFL